MSKSRCRMRRWGTSSLLLAAAAGTLAFVIPSSGLGAPQSLLPPAFGEEPPPAPAPAPVIRPPTSEPGTSTAIPTLHPAAPGTPPPAQQATAASAANEELPPAA